jgi:peptidyl-prolyl cis-trans isomerase A (cyclophilin A)
MRKVCLVLSTILITALAAAQSSSTQAPAASKPSTAAKTPVHHAATITTAVIETTVGNLHCTLFPDKAPIGVANFIGLATGTKDWKNPVSGATKHGVPLYDGTIFHRVIPEFMIQGGDPAGNGAGDPGYGFGVEASPDLRFDRPGRLAYAHSNLPNSNGSQFFITEDVAHSQHLSGLYTIFGQCDDASVELVKKIARMARDPSSDKPFRPVKIIHIKIVHSAPPAAAKPAGTAKPSAPTTKDPASSN